MAVVQKCPTDVVLYSERRTEDTSIAFGMCCQRAGVRPFMEPDWWCVSKRPAERFFASPGRELIDQERFRNQAGARMVSHRVWVACPLPEHTAKAVTTARIDPHDSNTFRRASASSWIFPHIMSQRVFTRSSERL